MNNYNKLCLMYFRNNVSHYCVRSRMVCYCPLYLPTLGVCWGCSIQCYCGTVSDVLMRNIPRYHDPTPFYFSPFRIAFMKCFSICFKQRLQKEASLTGKTSSIPLRTPVASSNIAQVNQNTSPGSRPKSGTCTGVNTGL